MKKIRSYTSIWNVEKVLYAINDINLPFPVTFTQITWFVLTEFIVILFADVPPLSMIEGAFLKYFGIPVALAYYVKDGVPAPVSGDYVFSELVNPVFTKDGDNLKVSVSVKYPDNKSKTTQISQYELVLHKDDILLTIKLTK